MFFYRLLTFFLPLLTATGLLVIVYKNSYFYYGTVFSILVAFLGTILLLQKKSKNWRQSLFFSFFSVLLIFSGLFYLVFVENFNIKIVLVLCLNILFFIYLSKLVDKLVDLNAQEPSRLFLLLEAAIVFFVSSGLFGLRDFLSYSIWIILAVFFILMFILINYIFYEKERLKLKKSHYSLITALIVTELFWALAIFPFVYYQKGLIVTFCFLLLIEFLLSGLEGKLSKKIIAKYLIIAFVIIAAILFTARWF